MDEHKVRELLEELYIHVAALPWKDEMFVRNEVAQQAAKSQVLDHTVRELMELNKESETK